MLPDDYQPPKEATMNAQGYGYTLPTGYDLPPELRQKLDVLATDLKLSNPEMQKLIDLHVELTEDFATRLMDHLLKIHRKITITICAIVTALNVIYNLL